MSLNINNLPNYSEIKNLEKISKKDGSGISYDELIGVWKFKSVWKNNSGQIDNISSSILQVLSASLELKKLVNEKNKLDFEIKNTINFGLLNIVFSGNAFLKGKNPILFFYFKCLQIKIGKIILIGKKLKKPEVKRTPFFSLIALNKLDNWMCARGKGGGVAIWVKS